MCQRNFVRWMGGMSEACLICTNVYLTVRCKAYQASLIMHMSSLHNGCTCLHSHTLLCKTCHVSSHSSPQHPPVGYRHTSGINHQKLLAVVHHPPKTQPRVGSRRCSDLCPAVQLCYCTAVCSVEAVQGAVACRYCQPGGTGAEAHAHVGTGGQGSGPLLAACLDDMVRHIGGGA